MLTKLVGFQGWRYVIEVLDLYVQIGQGPIVREVVLSGNVKR
jgi:hypothetical protein